ncbi:hypothetical protein [Nocardiopsis alborubida]|uniref:Pyrroloquinoline-quinone binding quinoprotein n=1 Tax=Nocardiopsis alborubida TaxID=146802 RepID=A0A7X6RTU6_9ACTN|nr:hypothetical protein [Nocardiopsis alborubida]NKZ01667.1 hypothetical protein [Nocardiopsis alborubida]
MAALVLFASACTAGFATEHTTASDPVGSIDIPRTITEVGWNWEAPEDIVVNAVHTIPSGVVVSVSDGVIALRGDTGEELWSYRRTGTTASGSNVTPNGESVAVSYLDETDTESETETTKHDVVVLDSFTGEITSEQVTDFTLVNSVPHNISLLEPTPERLGLLTQDHRLALGRNSENDLTLRAIGLSSGEEEWEQYQVFQPNDQGQEFLPGELVTAEDTVIVTGSFADPTETMSDLDAIQRHTAVIMGLDAGSGEEVWRVEHELDAPVTYRDIELSTYPGSGIVAAVMEGPGYFEQWLLDPATGNSVADNVFTLSGPDVISISQSGYATVKTDHEAETDTYTRMDFSGNLEEKITVEGAGVRIPRNFILPMDSSVARLNVGPTDDGWKPATIEVFDWQDSTDPHVIDLGIDVHRDPRVEEGARPLFGVAPPTDMILAPGAIVVTEMTEDTTVSDADTESRRLVGLT